MKKLLVFISIVTLLNAGVFHEFDTTDANGKPTGTKTISKSLSGKNTLVFTKTSEDETVRMIVKDSKKIIVPIQGESIKVTLKNNKGKKRKTTAEPLLANSAFYINLTKEDMEFINDSDVVEIIARDGFNNAHIYKFTTDGLIFKNIGENKKQD